MPRTLTTSALLLLLAGCAADTGGWTKPGITASAAADDYSECQDEARAATRRDAGIDTDIMATRGNDWQRGNAMQLRKEQMSRSTAAEGERVAASCMMAKGYRHSQQ